MDPSIIYEDEYIIAVNKPSGLVVHSGVKTGNTLVDWMSERFPYLKDVGEEDRSGVVHRLDKETSGVILFAKNNEVFDILKKHFAKGKIRKEYHAFLYGKPKRERGIISLSIGKSRSDFRKQATHNARGLLRSARTEYVVDHMCSCSNISFVKFYPKTGRTHQIRVHAKSLQTPIVCDSNYAPTMDSALGFNRLALHARRVIIDTHFYKKPLCIIADYPKDFSSALKECGGV